MFQYYNSWNLFTYKFDPSPCDSDVSTYLYEEQYNLQGDS